MKSENHLKEEVAKQMQDALTKELKDRGIYA